MMGDHHNTDYRAKTRCLRPIDNISFSVHEMVTGILAAVSPGCIISINQLHGDRKGVVRLTFKTIEAAKEMDTKVASRRVQINGVRLAAVSDTGHFVHLTLVDVPHYLCSEDLERELGIYGSVVNVRREYVEYQGYRLENETRHVLLSSLVRDVPRRITLDGHEVFIAVKSGGHRQKESAGKSGNPGEQTEPEPYMSETNSVPKHIMNSVFSYTVDNARRGQTAQATESAESGSTSDREHVENNHLDYRHPALNSKRHVLGSNSPRALSPLVGRKVYADSAFKGSQSDTEHHVTKSESRDTGHRRDRCRHSGECRTTPSQLLPENNHGFSCRPGEVSRRRSFDCDTEADRKVQTQLGRYLQRSKTPDRDLRV